jgi:hypothetical protein
MNQWTMITSITSIKTHNKAPPADSNKPIEIAMGTLPGIPVIDLFAGPGGLGEGFTSAGFELALSCEMDPIACETLSLRKFYHMFDKDKVPEEYYQFIKGKISKDQLRSAYPVQTKV